MYGRGATRKGKTGGNDGVYRKEEYRKGSNLDNRKRETMKD